MAPDAITLKHADDYVKALHASKVEVSAGERRRTIIEQAAILLKNEGLTIRPDDALLQEVVGLSEWPVVLRGKIDERYMALPPEVLISEIRHHQKYFNVQDSHGTLTHDYLLVTQLETEDDGAAILHGNGRVLRARLDDGVFIGIKTVTHLLKAGQKSLKGMIFHAKLGTMHEKTERIGSLASLLAVFVPHANLSLVKKASALCKADLTTGMVGEFPDLQGAMGRYYALDQAIEPEVADAIRDHYKPAGQKDSLPQNPLGITIALADRMDSLAGLFAVGDKPTGSKDPFALRRAALGVIRIIIEHKIRMPLSLLIDHALKQFPTATFAENKHETAEQLQQFFIDRLIRILKDQGIEHDRVKAAISSEESPDLVRIVSRAYALDDFLKHDDGANLLAAYKRASNIIESLDASDNSAATTPKSIHQSALEAEEEKALSVALENAYEPVIKAVKEEEYAQAMTLLAALRAPLDAFFDAVKVNDEDDAKRANRLQLLHNTCALMNQAAYMDALEGA